MNVVHFALGAPGCIHYRNINPCEYLNANGHRGFVVETDMSSKEDLKKIKEIIKDIADVVVVTRFNNWSGIVNLAHKYKKHVVYELDDSPILHESHNAKEIAIMNRWVERTEEMGTASDAVTVTTEALAEYMRQYNDHVYITPNLIDYDLKMWNAEKVDNGDKVVIGYFGGSSHLPDIKMISKTLMRLAKEMPAVHIYYGAVPTHVVTTDVSKKDPVATTIHDKRNAHAKAIHSLFAHLKKKRKRALYPEDIDKYGVVYASFDIAIAPLTPADFNKYKSNLKFLESSAYGIPMVASRSEPYTKSIIESGGGFIASTEEEFYQHLKKLVKSKVLRDEMGAAAKEYVNKNFSMKKSGHIYLDVYNDIVSRKVSNRQAIPIPSMLSRLNS